MKPHSLILFFLLHLQRCLYAQLTTPDSLYLAAGWQAGQRAVYQLESTTERKEYGQTVSSDAEKYLASLTIKERKDDHYRLEFKIDSILQLKTETSVEGRLFAAILGKNAFEYLTEPYGAYRRLANSEAISREVQAFFKEETAVGKETDPARLAVLQKAYASPEKTQKLLLDHIGSLHSVYGYTFPLDEETCWEEVRPSPANGEPAKVEVCDILTGLDSVNQTVRYQYRSVMGKEEATRSILETRESQKLKGARQGASYEIIDSRGLLLHYPSGWVMESRWSRNVITYSGKEKSSERISGQAFRLLELQEGEAESILPPGESLPYAEEMPRFPGCEDITDPEERTHCAKQKMYDFLYSKLKYPPEARKNRLEGICSVTFAVGSDGRIRDIRVTKDIGSGCGAELARAVGLMEEGWIPGRQGGEAVDVAYDLSVRFSLGE